MNCLIRIFIFSFSLLFISEVFSQTPTEDLLSENKHPLYVESLISSLLNIESSEEKIRLISRILKKDEKTGAEIIVFLLRSKVDQADQEFQYDVVDTAWNLMEDKTNIRKVLDVLISKKYLEAGSLIPRGAVRLGGPEGVKILKDGLKYSNSHIRYLSAYGLAYILEGQSAYETLNALRQAADINIRRGAVGGLGKLNYDSSMKKSDIQMIKSDKSPKIREAFIENLAGNRNSRWLGLVLDAFTNDPNVGVRRYAAQGVVFLDDRYEFEIEEQNRASYPEGKSKKRVLMERLLEDKNAGVRKELALAIHFLDDSVENNKLAEDMLIRLAKDRSLRVSSQAVRVALFRNAAAMGSEVLKTAVKAHPLRAVRGLGNLDLRRNERNFYSLLMGAQNKDFYSQKLSEIQKVLEEIAMDENQSQRIQLTALKILSRFYSENERGTNTLKKIAGLASSEETSSRAEYVFPSVVRKQAEKMLQSSCPMVFQ